jgi:nitroreductase
MVQICNGPIGPVYFTPASVCSFKQATEKNHRAKKIMALAPAKAYEFEHAKRLKAFAPVPASFDFLLSRSSVAPKTLVAPGPSAAEIELVVACAIRAPDHAGLKPWRFIAVEGDGRQKLAQAFVEIRRQNIPGVRGTELAMTWKKTMRAPTLIAVVARLHPDHPKVPLHEQYISVGAAIHGLLLGVHVLGYGAIMLSGKRARDPLVHSLFRLGSREQMVGFVSIGTPSKRISPKMRPAPSDYLQIWRGN